MRITGTAAILLLTAAAFATSSGCSSAPANPNSSAARDRGFKTVEATVVNREKEMPGSGGGIQGNPVYYLEFEAREDEVNTHYRFEVNQTQFNRYVEGTHVQLIIGDNRLRDIRPIR
jgi:hypothetical protein